MLRRYLRAGFCKLFAVRKDFINAVREHQAAFDLHLSDEAIEHLTFYCELVQEHNSLLHLVAPCSPEEFAVRHILESLTLLEHLPRNAKFADVGTGAGLPSIPCMIIRNDLKAVLIESKIKKIGFLREVIANLDLADRAELHGKQFTEVKKPDNVSYVTCRALDKFTAKLPHLINWSKNSVCLLFGGPSLRSAIKRCGIIFEETLLPMSEQRYLFVTGETNC